MHSRPTERRTDRDGVGGEEGGAEGGYEEEGPEEIPENRALTEVGLLNLINTPSEAASAAITDAVDKIKPPRGMR